MCEFWCHCEDAPYPENGEPRGGYIYVKLNTALEGNHVIVCPNCKHKHYRVVVKGKITGERFSLGMRTADEIEPMPSAYTKEKRKLGLIATWRMREAIGEAT